VKRLGTFVLALTFVFGFLGCSSSGANNLTEPTDETVYIHEHTITTIAPEAITVDQAPPLTIASNGESITPYLHFAFSGEWNGTGFISADGSDLISVLEDLETDGLIPCLEYSQDFDVILGDGVTTQHILLFDEAFNQLDTIWDIADLSKLDAGNYYVGMIATKEGKYIEEVNMHEYVGWACVVRLLID